MHGRLLECACRAGAISRMSMQSIVELPQSNQPRNSATQHAKAGTYRPLWSAGSFLLLGLCCLLLLSCAYVSQSIAGSPLESGAQPRHTSFLLSEHNSRHFILLCLVLGAGHGVLGFLHSVSALQRLPTIAGSLDVPERQQPSDSFHEPYLSGYRGP